VFVTLSNIGNTWRLICGRGGRGLSEYRAVIRWDHLAEALSLDALERHFHIPAIAALVRRGCVPPFPVAIEEWEGGYMLVMHGKG
jgi:hypothetical protein